MQLLPSLIFPINIILKDSYFYTLVCMTLITYRLKIIKTDNMY